MSTTKPPASMGGVPAGGTSGQVLAKTSGADYAVAWQNGGGSSTPTPVTYSTTIPLDTVDPGKVMTTNGLAKAGTNELIAITTNTVLTPGTRVPSGYCELSVYMDGTHTLDLSQFNCVSGSSLLTSGILLGTAGHVYNIAFASINSAPVAPQMGISDAGLTLIVVPPAAPIIYAGTSDTTTQIVQIVPGLGATATLQSVFYKRAIDPTYTAGPTGAYGPLTVTGLTASTSYNFKVVSSNSAGSSPDSNVLTVSTTASFSSPVSTDTQVSDRVNRADSVSNLATATTGQTWGQDSGTWGTSGQRIYCSTGAGTGNVGASFDCGLSDYDLSADVITTTGNGAGVKFRAVDDSNYLLVQLAVGSNTVNLWKNVANSFTNLGSATVSGMSAITNEVRIVANGTSINVYINGAGTATITATSSQFQTATRVGVLQSVATPNGQVFGSILVKPAASATARRVAVWNGDKYTPRILEADTSSLKAFYGWANPNKEGVTLATGDQWRRTPNSGAIPIILDTDLSTDVDDVIDIKTAIVYHAEGLVNLLGVAVTTSKSKAPGAARAVMQFYGYGSIPVASYAPLGAFDPGTPSSVMDYLYDNFTHTGVGLANTVTDTTTAIASWLNAAPTGVVYVMTGFCKGLRAFLQASAANTTLFNAKVSRVIAVAGYYPNSSGPGPEFNLQQNALDWNWLTANIGVPVTWVGIELGNAMGNAGYAYLNARQSAGDIVRTAIAQYPASAGVGRFPWSVPAFHYLAQGKGRYQISTVAGTNAIDASTGANTFTAGAGTQEYLVIPDIAYNFKTMVESLIAADVVSGTKVWNGSAWT